MRWRYAPRFIAPAYFFLQSVFRRWLTASRSKRLLYIAPCTADVLYGVELALEDGTERMLRLFFMIIDKLYFEMSLFIGNFAGEGI